MSDSATPLWYPYAQMKTMSPPLPVTRAEGALLHLTDGRTLIDSIASWWCVIHGYNHPALNDAARNQLDRMAHVMLGGLTHDPARQLAHELVAITPPGLDHVFFSDSGSIGVEVALKMAVQYWVHKGEPGKTRFAALKQAYHGDTWGAMSVCDPDDGMHSLFAGIVHPNTFLPAPRGGFDADAETLRTDLDALWELLANHHHEIAALIVEPLLQAAGGFNMYSPVYLQEAHTLCNEYDVLLIFDEVATGFGRTGALFAAEHAGVSPDIMVLGKGLTAGYTGHAATLASHEIFNTFWDDDPGKAFMHGPTFMANPLACAVARTSLQLCQAPDFLPTIQRIEQQLCEGLLNLRGAGIRGTRVLGATGVIEVEDRAVYAGLQDFAAERGVWLRPFDRYIYTMPPYIISEAQLATVLDVMQKWFTR